MPRPSTADVQVRVRVASGSRRDGLAPAYVVPHAWTEDGISVDGGGTGAHLLLTAVACCVLNDVYREAQEPGIALAGVRVDAVGGFDSTTWSSTTIAYDVDVDSDAPQQVVDGLLARVDEVAEIPRVVRGSVAVTRERSEA
ncbi:MULTISPECIES: OsmC family protein [unclassified Nocardioides]|uniref:OsmC family protein n=1 Tax=unclassified Nocardioides TaxID=2615069 RepID=UPI0030156F95